LVQTNRTNLSIFQTSAKATIKPVMSATVLRRW